jgi:hypothetical protein
MIFCLNLTLIGNYGLKNLMLLAINFVNFDDNFLDLLFRLGEEEVVKLNDGRIINIPNEEELSTVIGIDIFCIFIFVFLSLFAIFPLNKIIEGKFDLTPGGDKNPYRFLNMNHLKSIMILFIIYIVIMSIIDYYNEHLKKKEEFKYVKNVKDLKDSCKIGIIFKIIIFSLFGVLFLIHSFDTFCSGLNLPMVTKKKGSIIYSSTHKMFNTLHDYIISSGYSIHKGLLDEKTHSGRDILVFKYLTETYVIEEEKEKEKDKKKEKIDLTEIISQINKTNQTNKINETKIDERVNDNDKNKTKKNSTKQKMRKKEEWKVIEFQHQLNEKKNNLFFFMSLLFRQPRLEYALHHLAYEGKNKLENFNEKVWIPHLIYRLFNDKVIGRNITKIKIEKIRYSLPKYNIDNNFRTSFVSKYLDETNLTQIEEYLKKHNSLIINKDNKKSIFCFIPIHSIIYALLFIFTVKKVIPLIPNDDNDGQKIKKDDKDDKDTNNDDNDK